MNADKEKERRMSELVSELNKASDAYYNGREEIMTDYEWDALFDELKSLEAETGTVLPDSPTANVSADNTAGEKEPHEFPALSLAKTKKEADLVKWAGGRPVWMSWKLDGLTLVVTYDGGHLTKVVTRGNGLEGTNITHLAAAINGIKSSIKETGHLVIRGEAVISYADFNRYVMESGEDYANPRNLASGSVTLKDAAEVKKRNIHWIPFTLVYCERDIISWGERMNFLEENGFDTVEHEFIENPDETHIHDAVARWTKKVTDGLNPYPVDGLVLDYDDTIYAAGGTVTGHHALRAGYAFKWADESASSELDHIEWSCAASTITPVAVFKPVELEGTTVKRASLCNVSECERLGIGGRGTVLSVIKANKIIPKVVKVIKKEGDLAIPEHCPVCGAPTRVNISSASDTKTLKCTNPDCAAKKLKKFARFVSKQGMEIDGISEQTLNRFINEGWIKNYGDIFRLRDHRDEIEKLDGFGKKSAENLMNALDKASSADDAKLIFALSIPLTGPDVAARLLSAYPLSELVSMAEETDDPEIFASIGGIGPEKSAAFVKWFHDPENVKNFDDLTQYINVRETERKPAGKRCGGLTFVITGDVYHYKNRSELKDYIVSQGGKVTGSVSKKTNFLINNDITSTSAKNTKARSLGIPIISEDEFIKRFA